MYTVWFECGARAIYHFVCAEKSNLHVENIYIYLLVLCVLFFFLQFQIKTTKQ